MKTKLSLPAFAIAGVVLLAGIFAFHSDSASHETVIIRAQQGMTDRDSDLIVYKGKGQSEKFEMGKWQHSLERTNYEKIVTAVMKYADMGYEIKSAYETVDGSKSLYTTYVIVKK